MNFARRSEVETGGGLFAVAGVPDSAFISSRLPRVSLDPVGGIEGMAEAEEAPKLSRLRSDWAVAAEAEADPGGNELNIGSLDSDEKGGGEAEFKAKAFEF